MTAMILISTAAILVAIVGCAVIWRMDALRAEEIEHTRAPAPAPRPTTPQLGSTNGSLPASPRSS